MDGNLADVTNIAADATHHGPEPGPVDEAWHSETQRNILQELGEAREYIRILEEQILDIRQDVVRLKDEAWVVSHSQGISVNTDTLSCFGFRRCSSARGDNEHLANLGAVSTNIPAVQSAPMLLTHRS